MVFKRLKVKHFVEQQPNVIQIFLNRTGLLTLYQEILPFHCCQKK